MTSGRVYVDFDDVLCETARDLAALLERSTGRHIEYEDIHWFDLRKSFKLTAQDLDSFLDAAHQPEIIEKIPLVTGAAKTLKGWADSGLDVCILTGRPPATEASSRRWLAAHGIPFSELLFVDKYGRHGGIPGCVTLDEVREMDFLFAVDDAPRMLNYLISEMSVPVLIFDRPWNRKTLDPIPAGRDVRRCRSHEEIRRQADLLLNT